MNRAFTNILTSNVPETAAFYEALLGMQRAGDFGWFVLLSHKDMPGFELGILSKTHETIPKDLPQGQGGSILTFVVPDLDEVAEKARAMQADIIQPPTDLPYGQRRLMLRDPAGSAVDISSPIRD
ncbi:VOC family protein [Yoonia sp. BS5-3]|uniref:VOC family protein n=1 Tax=Yoonia phaeophyticola TaxID=3137369 RepID=A0ABZ2V5A6_9RHOB